MNIITALMKHHIRVSNGDRWLVWNKKTEQWIVYERKYHAKKTITVIETNSQDRAINELLGDDEQ